VDYEEPIIPQSVKVGRPGPDRRKNPKPGFVPDLFAAETVSDLLFLLPGERALPRHQNPQEQKNNDFQTTGHGQLTEVFPRLPSQTVSFFRHLKQGGENLSMTFGRGEGLGAAKKN
jgi:hypothetical protein